MGDSYCPFMGKKGKSWGELDLSGIAGRVAGLPPEVDSPLRALVAAARKAGIPQERVQRLIEEAFEEPVSAPPSRRARR